MAAIAKTNDIYYDWYTEWMRMKCMNEFQWMTSNWTEFTDSGMPTYSTRYMNCHFWVVVGARDVADDAAVVAVDDHNVAECVEMHVGIWRKTLQSNKLERDWNKWKKVNAKSDLFVMETHTDELFPIFHSTPIPFANEIFLNYTNLIAI